MRGGGSEIRTLVSDPLVADVNRMSGLRLFAEGKVATAGLRVANEKKPAPLQALVDSRPATRGSSCQRVDRWSCASLCHRRRFKEMTQEKAASEWTRSFPP